MKLSKYYRKEHVGEDCYVLYNTLHMKPIIAKQDEVSKVENMGIHDPAVVEELLHSGIYVLDDSIDSNALIELQSNVESRFGEIKIVYIILTDVCNLRCSYCAVKNIADKNHVIDTYSLSKEKYTKFVKEYVSYAISHNISDPEFIFYGGEPLLNWSALIEIVELINTTANSTITPKYTVVTNGTLLTEDKIIFCKEHKINIGLSVDGPRSITDMTRKAENGMGAYPMIIHAMELLKKHDYIPSLSVTISEDVLRNQATVIDWLQEMHLSFGIKDISYNLLRFQDEGFDKKKYSIAASSFIIASYKQLGDIINDSRINRKILSLTRSTFFYGDCAAITGNQIVLKANGDIGLCQVFCQSDTRKNGSRKLKAFLQRWQTKIIFACRLRLTEKFYLIKVKWVNTIIYGSHKPNTHHIQISLGDHGRIPSGLPCGHIRPSIAVRHHRRPENTPQRHRTACGVWRGYCQRPQGSEPLPCGDPSL